MAVVGEAHILVRAVTTHVRKDIRDGFKGLSGVASDEGKSVGKAFSGGLTGEMMANADQLTSLARKGYFAQSAIGALLGSVSALGGGLGGLIGITLSAASSMTVMANAMVTMKVASAVGKMAFNGISAAVGNAANSAGGAKKSIKELREEMEDLAFAAEEAALSQESAALKLEKARETLSRVQNLPPDNRARREAELAFKQAELGYRRAKDKAEDAQEELNNPKKRGGAGGTDPFKDLTKSQKVFAMFLVENRYRMKQLREAAARGFLPVLQKQMQTLFKNGAFDNLVSGIANVGKGLGEATKNFSQSFFTKDTINNMGGFFESVSKSISIIGRVAGNALRGFFTYLKLTEPLLAKFTTFLDRRTDKFAADMVNNGGSIQRFFLRSSEYAAKFGEIFSNVWLRIKQFVANTTGPGSGGELLLDYFVKATGEFKKMDSSIRAFEAQNYFKKTAENTLSILTAFKGLFDILTDLGTMPEVKEFWDIIASGNNDFRSLLKSAVRTAPALARVLVQLVSVFQAIADDKQTSTFLDTFAEGLRVFSRTLKMLMPLLSAVGPIFGFLAALGLVTKGIKFLALAISGLLIKTAIIPLLTIFVSLTGATGAAGAALTGLSATAARAATAINIAFFSTPIVGWAAAAVAALAALGVALSNWSAGVADQNMKETIGLAKDSQASYKDLLDDARKTNWTSILQENNAYQITDSLLKMTVGTDSLSLALGKLREHQNTAAAGFGWWNAGSLAQGAMQDMAGTFERYGAALAERFGEEGIGGVRDGLQFLQDEFDLTNTELRTTYREMDATRNVVREFADSLGVTVTNADGTTNALKELDFIQNDYRVTAAIAKIKQDQFNQALNETIKSFFDFEGPLKQNKEDVKKWAISVAKATEKTSDTWKDYYKDFDETGFSTDYYFSKLNQQAKAATDYAMNLVKAKSKLSEKAFNQLFSMGKAGAPLVAKIAATSEAELGKVESDLEKLAGLGAGSLSSTVASAFNRQNIIDAIKKKNPRIGGDVLADLVNLDNASLMEKFGIGFRDLVQTSIQDKPLGVTAKWVPGQAKTLMDELANDVNKLPVYMTTVKPKKDGGVIEKKDGGWLPKFAGGAIAGAQGPRSDNIMAMLSAGEYVINAASTYRYRPLLDAINSGSIDRLQNTGNMQSAAGNNVSIVVNAAPGMDESQVASMVAQKLNSALNMGGRI